MAYGSRRFTEGGHSNGHSNMEHWEHTAKIKISTRKARRRNDRMVCRNWHRDY